MRNHKRLAIFSQYLPLVERNFIYIWLIIAAILISAASGCSVKLVSDYDEIFDSSATATQKKIDGFLQSLMDESSPMRNYSNAKATYQDILNDIHSLKIRAEANNADNLNKQTLGQLDTIDKNIRQLQHLHEQEPTGPSVEFVKNAEDLIDIQFEAMLKFELAKKRGSTSAGAS